VELVRELHSQASKAEIDFEILCIDDASSLHKEENRIIKSFSHCRYIESETNLGRSKIRNLLAEEAKFNNLLFLDCDVEILHPDYIRTYLKYLEQYDIVSGRRVYSETPPLQKEYYFHWFYGVKRETKSKNFMSNNFFIKKSLWQFSKFNEDITLYGHEDTLFQVELEEKNIHIHFIANPVVHAGLDSTEAFIVKTRESVKNLMFLFDKKIITDKNIDRFSLLKAYLRIRTFKVDKLLKCLFPIVKPAFEKNFSSRHPSLFLFDIYKLMYLSYISGKRELSQSYSPAF
jgi:glycosyltransferase involved in cell wall biosynthesis